MLQPIRNVNYIAFFRSLHSSSSSSVVILMHMEFMILFVGNFGIAKSREKKDCQTTFVVKVWIRRAASKNRVFFCCCLFVYSFCFTLCNTVIVILCYLLLMRMMTWIFFAFCTGYLVFDWIAWIKTSLIQKKKFVTDLSKVRVSSIFKWKLTVTFAVAK